MTAKKESQLDKLIALGQQSGFVNKGEATSATENSTVTEQEEKKTEPKREGEGTVAKKAVKQKEAKPTPAISNKLNSLNLNPFPWMEASHDVIKPLIVEMPQDLKLLLEGIARAVPGQSMKSIVVHILKSELPGIAKELNLPLPDSLKDL
ncbi:hypothetical protein [Methylophilus sp. QUAN]|uniref:hypothetical protein n=1 Tax=Methylophilus sp. QUAN TaxID=2781020 RepID=UPI00188EFB21|nr:hypothetical protein [Methylophilus sp. QUAN]MBF4991017.1 hypothetical protein [Methylophilus sp. QUAN]